MAERRGSLTALVAGTILAGSIGMTGCTDLAPDDETCGTVPGCVPPPPPLPENWTCIDEEPVVKEAPPDLIALTLFVVDLANPGVVPPNLQLQTCAIIDIGCVAPLADPMTGVGVATAPLPPILQGIQMADPTGTLARAARQILLPYDPNLFYGFIRLSADNYATVDFVLLDELQFNLEDVFPVPTPQGGTINVAALLVDPIGIPRLETLNNFYMGVGEVRDTSKATTVARTFDCDGRRASNVALDVDIDGALWAFQGGLPVPGEDKVTDSQGVIGYANLEPVNHTLSALVPQQTRSYFEAAVPARAGGIVTLEMRPPNARRRQLNVTLRE